MNPSSTSSCSQPQSLTINNDSPNVNVHDNVWRINIDQMDDLPSHVNFLRVNTQGQPISGTVLLTLIDTNQQQLGPYGTQITNGHAFSIQNLPSIPLSMIELQFPDGIQSSSYLVDMTICPMPTASQSSSTIFFRCSYPSSFRIFTVY